MEWAAGRDSTGGRHQAAASLPARPVSGSALARAHLEYREVHLIPETASPRFVSDPGVLRRVRDALASGGPR